MKIVVDMNLSPQWVPLLKQRVMNQSIGLKLGLPMPRTAKSWNGLTLINMSYLPMTLISLPYLRQPMPIPQAYCRFVRRMYRRRHYLPWSYYL